MRASSTSLVFALALAAPACLRPSEPVPAPATDKAVEAASRVANVSGAIDVGQAIETVRARWHAEGLTHLRVAVNVSARQLASVAVTAYANARHNPYAQMRDVQCTLDTVETIEGINRFIVDGLPLKTYDCSQITDGYAALILATEEGLARLGLKPSQCVRVAGHHQRSRERRQRGQVIAEPVDGCVQRGEGDALTVTTGAVQAQRATAQRALGTGEQCALADAAVAPHQHA